MAGALIGLGIGTLGGIMIAPREFKTLSDYSLGAIINTLGDGDNFVAGQVPTMNGYALGGYTFGYSTTGAPTLRVNGRYESLREFINTHKNY